MKYEHEQYFKTATCDQGVKLFFIAKLLIKIKIISGIPIGLY